MPNDLKPHFASLLTTLLISCGSATAAEDTDTTSPFFAKPYVQLGNHPHLLKSEAEELLWISKEHMNWSIDLKAHDSKNWLPVKNVIQHRPVDQSKHPDLETYSCELTGLAPGKLFDYRVQLDKKEVFHATSQARKTAEQALNIVIFGDCAAGTIAQKKIAYQCDKFNPDLVVVPGDVVYNRGLFSEYAKRFFPVYNADESDPKVGAPITRSHLLVPVLGNHDIAYVRGTYFTDLNKFPDALAYFSVWSQPLNGPVTKLGAKFATPIDGSAENKNSFLSSAGSHYPAMSSYSFDYGNSHWLVLDGNYYMDWTNSNLRDWVSKDLAAAKNSRWKFVTFHQPGFSDDVEHSLEQRMRLLSDVFEQNGVDVVWAGHVHNYQRTFPLFFKAAQKEGRLSINPDGTVPGTFRLDKDYNGKNVTKPKGVIYVITGAGGQELYSEKQQTDKVEFVDKFNGKVHSFTVCDITGDTMNVRQLDEDGVPIDEFKVTKK